MRTTEEYYVEYSNFDEGHSEGEFTDYADALLRYGEILSEGKYDTVSIVKVTTLIKEVKHCRDGMEEY